MFTSISDIRANNEAKGFHFFDPTSMRFFNSRILSGLYGGRYFVTSEKGPDNIRLYTVRKANDDGTINSVNGFQQYPTIDSARREAQRLGTG